MSAYTNFRDEWSTEEKRMVLEMYQEFRLRWEVSGLSLYHLPPSSGESIGEDKKAHPK